MAQLVENNVVRQMFGDKRDFIIKIQIPPLGATAPTSLLIANGNFFYRKIIASLKICDFLPNQRPSHLSVLKVVPPPETGPQTPPYSFDDKKSFHHRVFSPIFIIKIILPSLNQSK